jgi:hypothetical protein
MFFKNIENWSKQKLRGLDFLFNLLHFVALVLVPIIIVGYNYKLFTKEDGFKLTAIGIIVIIILGLYSYIKLKKVIDNLPQVKLSQQRFKFTIQTILSLLPIIIIIVGLELAKTNFSIAINVATWCSVSFACAMIIDGLFLKYTSQEIALRCKTLEIVEVEKRKKLV